MIIFHKIFINHLVFKKEINENKISRKNSRNILRTGDNLIPTRGCLDIDSS